MDAGTVVGERYQLVSRLGEGGYGEVWKGFDQSLDRHVAVKFIRAEKFPLQEELDEAEQRFRREARVTAKLRHPGVPIVYDVGTHETSLFLVMELVDGYRIDHLIDEHDPLPVAWAAAIGAQVCAVLTVAHAQSVIHRDLKPVNLILCADGTVKVLDFGIAAVLDPGATVITRLGEGVGTFCYMAPEQAITGKADARSDLYALGCVLHELLAGRRVFESAVPQAELARHYSEAPPRLRSLRADVPTGLEDLVLSLLAKNPADRPASAAEVYERLLPYVTALPPLPGATTAAPAPDPGRMYAVVAERIAETALVGPPIPSQPTPPASRLSRNELIAAKKQAEGLAIDGRLSQAIEVLKDAVSACAALPAERQLLIALRMDLANARFGARDYAAALRDFEGVLPTLADMLGVRHHAVFDCRYNQALSMAALGRNEAALSRMTALLADARVTLGESDPFPLLLRREIAALLIKLGERRQAVTLLCALLPEMIAVLGVDDAETRQAQTLLENLERLDDPGHEITGC
ncbi:serine/threonine-protein kinase [Sphaerimonospora thailandensis]|uniref:non-specific serine/threonine protein kinase n=1 Tax=Sphaerimonospora thailandensis TaxID=795644 RepID=A0A8J3REE6_9ACTN|nr:serine/threonine-protein kinase [Sphaerimonospora thailandensis]GIH73210.1 protein kinase [Sphaerimonospora thailandensis]